LFAKLKGEVKLKKRLMLMTLVLALILAAAVGCAPEKEVENPVVEPAQETPVELSITDDFGNTITLEKAAERIVSLAPSNTEILFAIGAGDAVIGVTTYDDFPLEVLEIEKIGDFNGINLERIIELQPDLVVNYGDGITEETQRLVEAGITIVGFEPESIEEIVETINRIGVLTGKSKEADALVKEMLNKEAELLVKIEGLDKKKVFYEIWHEPLMAAGPGSFVDQLITLAGGTNIASDAESEYPQFDLEQLIERNPEVYLTANDLPEKTADSIKQRPGFENLDAVKNNQIYLLDGNILSRPGPRIIQALELLIEAIHPEI
jgi:iron complex transport system substrate-binding protein